jgi:hypothetical protein
MAPPTITSALTNVLTTVAPLDATNWSKFGKGFRIFLLGLDALWVVNGTGPAADNADQASLDRMLVPYLYSKVTEDYQYLVEDATSAFAAWKALKSHFEKSNMTNRFVARGELHAIMHNPSKEVSVYIRAIADAVAKLKAMGVTIDDTTHKDLILLNLHPSFRAVRTILLARATEPSLEDITSLLNASSADPGIKQEEDNLSGMAFLARTGPPHRTAPAVTTAPSSPLTGKIGADGFPVDSQGSRWCDPTNNNCHRCGRVGHIAHKCMHTMPSFIKDWILSNARTFPTASAAFAAALESGLTPDTFAEMYDHHAGFQSAAFSATVPMHAPNGKPWDELTPEESRRYAIRT